MALLTETDDVLFYVFHQYLIIHLIKNLQEIFKFTATYRYLYISVIYEQNQKGGRDEMLYGGDEMLY